MFHKRHTFEENVMKSNFDNRARNFVVKNMHINKGGAHVNRRRQDILTGDLDEQLDDYLAPWEMDAQNEDGEGSASAELIQTGAIYQNINNTGYIIAHHRLDNFYI